MATLFLDTETYSEVPIKYGTHRYAEKVEIIVAAWAWDDNAVIVDDATIDNAHSLETLQSLINQADRVVIHNSYFDRTVLHYNGIGLPPEKIIDTMVLAYAHSLPGSLGKLCDVLNVPTDKAKDKDGKRLINLFCQPRPKKQKLRRATRETHPEEWAKFLEYARLDIEAMRAVYKRIPKWNWTASERELWLLDQKINDRGVAIDLELVEAAIAAVDQEQAALAEQAQDMTGGFVTTALQRDAMLRYILEAYEIPMDDLRGVTIEKMLENDNYPTELLDLLRVRLKASTTSTAKYKALQKATSTDGRLRGTLQFCGASRTGRAAGRLVQLQNLPRPNLKNDIIDGGIRFLKAGCPELATDNIMELTSNAIRGCIVAPPGKKLVVADLSNIEGRVLAWLAGEEWKLEAFRQFDQGVGHDLYKLAYARSFRVAPEDVTKGQRQVGKVQELALGYEGGVGAFITFAAVYGIDLDDMAQKALPALGAGLIDEANGAWEWMQEQKRPTFGLSRETWVACDAIKRAWRYAHPKTSQFWKQLQQAVISAVESPSREFRVGDHIVVIRNGAWLKIIMPSGRALSYPAVRVEDGKISYTGVNQYTRQWGRIYSYGGKIAENGTQFTARDVFFSSMIPVETAGYKIITHVHDELICETPDSPEFNAEHLASIMSTNPSWAEGLPLAAAGFETYRYKKED